MAQDKELDQDLFPKNRNKNKIIILMIYLIT